MKAKVMGLLVLAVLLGLCVGQAPAQEKKSQMYLVEEVLVKPSADAAFYELEKEAVALCQKQKWPYAWTCYAADDYRYYFVMPIGNLAGVLSALPQRISPLAPTSELAILAASKASMASCSWVMMPAVTLSLTAALEAWEAELVPS